MSDDVEGGLSQWVMKANDLKDYLGPDSHHVRVVDDLISEIYRLKGESARIRRYVAPLERLILSLRSAETFIPHDLSARLDYAAHHINPEVVPDLEDFDKSHYELKLEHDKALARIRVLEDILMKLGPPQWRVRLTGQGEWRYFGGFLRDASPDEHQILKELEQRADETFEDYEYD